MPEIIGFFGFEKFIHMVCEVLDNGGVGGYVATAAFFMPA